MIVIEVPAGPHLYDVYDLVLTHWRGYTLGELRQLTEQVGFRTLYASHLGFFLYPAFAWTKRAGGVLPRLPKYRRLGWLSALDRQGVIRSCTA